MPQISHFYLLTILYPVWIRKRKNFPSLVHICPSDMHMSDRFSARKGDDETVFCLLSVLFF